MGRLWRGLTVNVPIHPSREHLNEMEHPNYTYNLKAAFFKGLNEGYAASRDCWIAECWKINAV